MTLLRSFDLASRRIRIPDRRSVALPPGFERLVDHPDFQRLRRVRQLGPIHLVYPGALHSRFEHSLGVFSAALSYLRSLERNEAFADRVQDSDRASLLAAALLHDVGHYPFAHSLEAIHSRAFEAPRHEDLAADLICGRVTTADGGPSLGEIVEDALGVDRERVARLVRLGASTELPDIDQLLASIINSAIDADKLDYLERDSIHMGVPYGRMPDRERLLDNLTVNPTGSRIALTEKGRVAGEIFTFSRYLMFSEAYWHHTARAASAMIERALEAFLRREQPSAEGLRRVLLSHSDDELLERILRPTHGTVDGGRADFGVAGQLLQAFPLRSDGLYKRLLTLNRQLENTDHRRAYDAIYRMDRAQCDGLALRMRASLSRLAGHPLAPGDLLIDTPPRDKDQVDLVEVVFDGPGGALALPLDQVSQVVRGVTTDFVKVVKKIRVFVAPGVRARLRPRWSQVEEALLSEILG